MGAPRDFKRDLAGSVEADVLALFDRAYTAYFPACHRIQRTHENLAVQRLGVDTIVYTAPAVFHRIDEKKRDKDYDDYLLEFEHLHASGHRKPGWIEKTLTLDFLAYAFVPTGRVHFLPWPALKRAWLVHGADWIDRHFISESPNRGYTTRGVCVPFGEVWDAMGQSCVAEVSA